MNGKVRQLRTVALAAAALACAAGVLIALPMGGAVPASAQGWWPWSQPSSPPSRPPPVPRQPPVPNEPVYRDDAYRPAQPQPPPPGYGQYPNYGPGGSAQVPTGRPPICVTLEQRLVAERQRGSATRDQLPRIENDLRQVQRQIQASQAQLERADCYDYFLFSKTLRRSRQCVDLAAQVDASKRKAAELDAQRQQIVGTRDRSFEDDIVRDLARNGCGAIYNQEAQRRGPSGPFSSLWQDEETGPGQRGGTDFGTLPFATYRTVCVRLCDGYFFPVSFSTLKTHFDRDMEECQSKCAAPAELYFYQNPGGAMEQAISARNQTPYTSLKTAFRYRKEYVQGCSCKQAEYTPSPADRGDRKAEAAPPPATRQASR